MGSPTVNIPLVGQTEATSITHHTLDRGPQGPAIETFHSVLTPPGPDAAEACPSGPPIHLGGRSSAKDRKDALALLQYARDNPHMVTEIEWILQEPMSPEAALFPECTPLHEAPLPS